MNLKEKTLKTGVKITYDKKGNIKTVTSPYFVDVRPKLKNYKSNDFGVINFIEDISKYLNTLCRH